MRLRNTRDYLMHMGTPMFKSDFLYSIDFNRHYEVRESSDQEDCAPPTRYFLQEIFGVARSLWEVFICDVRGHQFVAISHDAENGGVAMQCARCGCLKSIYH